MDYAIEGMHCGSCAARVEGALARLPGAGEVSVNYATKRARVRGDVPSAKVLSEVARLGYAAEPLAATGSAPKSRGKTDAARRSELVLATVLTLPVFVLGMSHHPFPGNGLIQLLLTTILLAGPGRIFFTRAARLAVRGGVNMDTLVALGVGAAYVASLISMMRGTFAYYFESAAVIATLVLLGQHLEENARRGSAQAVEKLRGLQLRTVRKRFPDGSEQDVDFEALSLGDLFVVRPGEHVALDGVVVEGHAALDESLVTGESIPVARGKGDDVIGTTINTSTTPLLVRATVHPAETVLARLVSLVEDAQASKAAAQRLADRVARIFVPIVLVVAVATLLYWMLARDAAFLDALMPAVAVLVIACPCALGLATPTAILTGTGRAARDLILIRSAPGLESAGALTVAIVDKTGTLTEGRPVVTSLAIEAPFQRAEVLALTAAIEGASTHPLARALLKYAHEAAAPLAQRLDFKDRPGIGLAGQVLLDGKRYDVLAGSFAMLAEAAIALPDAWRQLEGDPQSLVFVVIDGKAAAVFTVKDPIRASTRAALATLREMGLSVVMATGDRDAPARAVAAELGITDVRAALKPEAKLQLVKELRAKGERVGMVGDGINDAPALAEADVGFAVGDGSDLAGDAADIVIPHGNLAKVAEAIEISRKTMRVIRQNLAWAFAYNVLAIPLAAAGHLSPMIAAGTMALSSLSVVGNSLRLSGMKARR